MVILPCEEIFGIELTYNEQKDAIAQRAEGDYGHSTVLIALKRSHPCCYDIKNRRMAFTQKYAHLRESLEAISWEYLDYSIGVPHRIIVRYID